jgi:hypothetical protein
LVLWQPEHWTVFVDTFVRSSQVPSSKLCEGRSIWTVFVGSYSRLFSLGFWTSSNTALLDDVPPFFPIETMLAPFLRFIISPVRKHQMLLTLRKSERLFQLCFQLDLLTPFLMSTMFSSEPSNFPPTWPSKPTTALHAINSKCYSK